MTFPEFERSLRTDTVPPPALPPPLRALWFAANGQWGAAHAVAQEDESADGSWIHAHLHHEEGDHANASYWYARAGKPVFSGSVAAEREALIRHFLER